MAVLDPYRPKVRQPQQPDGRQEGEPDQVTSYAPHDTASPELGDEESIAGAVAVSAARRPAYLAEASSPSSRTPAGPC